MTKKTPDGLCRFYFWRGDDYQTIIPVTVTRTPKADVAREKRGPFNLMQMPQDFLLIVPLRPPNIQTDFLKMDAPVP